MPESRTVLTIDHHIQTRTDTERKLEVLLEMAQVLGQEIHLDRMLALMVSEVTGAMGAERSSL